MRQKEALDILKLGKNVYLTGAAGSGKTYVLNEYINHLKKNRIPVGITASTGIAATHLGGITIHSWAGIGIAAHLSDDELHKLTKKSYLKKRITSAQVLIIDEVSMLDAARLDLINRVCGMFRDPRLPFGGLQVVLSGDFFQLPPIAREDEQEVDFVDTSYAWKELNPHICYLSEQHRQEDDGYLSVLNAIRDQKVGEETKEHLRKRYKQSVDHFDEPTKIYTHNVNVDAVNARELEKLPGDVEVYEMVRKGPAKLTDTLVKGCLAPEELHLKEGAVVMFVKNNFEEHYVNGTLGRVTSFDAETGLPIVETTSGKEIYVQPADWSIMEDGKVRASITQLPLRLAWAITVHKSQGMSLDAAEIDLSKSFGPGMGYVALSRVRSLAGLSLLGMHTDAFAVHPRVAKLDSVLRDKSAHSAKKLGKLTTIEKEEKKKAFIESRALPEGKENNAQKQDTYEQTATLVRKKKSLAEMAREREKTVGTIFKHLEILKEKGTLPNITYLKPDETSLAEMHEAFDEAGDTKLTPVYKILNKKYTFNELRLARLFL